MGLAVGQQKAIVRSNTWQKVAITDGNREFCLVLETVNALGEVTLPFIVWVNKVHCVGFYADADDDDNRPPTFSRSPSGYMDDELGFDYISKHFDRYTARVESVDLTASTSIDASASAGTDAGAGSTYRMLIVDGHSSHIAWPVVEYALDHDIILYCLPAHSTHLMQPLDVACFGPLAKAYQSALQIFIYENPGRAFGEQEFWKCLCIARDQALTKSNIMSGFSDSGLLPFNSERVINRGTIKVEQPADLTTLLNVANIRSTVSQLPMTPHSRAVVQESLDFMETKVVKYLIIEPNSHGVKSLRSGTQVKPRSQKHIKGPRILHRAYIEQAKARIAAAETRDAEKAANREAVKLAKQLKAQQAIEAAREHQTATRGGPSIRARGGARIARFRLSRQQRFNADGADLQRLQRAMAFMKLSDTYAASQD